MILGRPDAEQMKEDVAVAIDTSKSEDDRLAALDHLEMLVEHIDNANDLEKLHLWQPLDTLLKSSDLSTAIKVQVLWVVGTAIQNNPAAQDVYLSYNPLPTLLGFLTPSVSSTLATRAKAIYALSGLLKHNAPAVRQLEKPDIDGWVELCEALQDPEISVRRKTAFLLNTLILPATSNPVTPQRNPPLLIETQSATTHTTAITATSTGTVAGPPSTTTTTLPGPSLHTVDEQTANNLDTVHANSHAAQLRDASRNDTSRIALDAFRKYSIIDTVVSALTNPLPYGEDGESDHPDIDFEEKAMRLLYTYGVSSDGFFTDKEKRSLGQWIEREKQVDGGSSDVAERWGFSASELEALIQRLD